MQELCNQEKQHVSSKEKELQESKEEIEVKFI